MLGATKAAEAMAKRWQAEDRAKGYAKGWAKGRAEWRKAQRKAIRERLERFAAQGLSLAEALQRLDDEWPDDNEIALYLPSVSCPRRVPLRGRLVRLIRKAGIM